MTVVSLDPLAQAANNLAYWAYQGGFRGQALTRMVAYGLAESGGDPHAHNYNPATGDDSYGLWQINYFGGLRQSRTQRYGDPATLYDPVKNAQAAYDLSGGGTHFNDWAADDKNGRYQKYLPYALTATAGFGGGTMPETPPPNSFAGGVVQASSTDDCLIHLPSVAGIGGGCIFHRSWGRAILGALILSGGVLVGGLGVTLLAGKSVSSVAQFIPNPAMQVVSAVQQRSVRQKAAIGPQNSREKAAQRRASRGRSVKMEDLPDYEDDEPF